MAAPYAAAGHGLHSMLHPEPVRLAATLSSSPMAAPAVAARRALASINGLQSSRYPNVISTWGDALRVLWTLHASMARLNLS